MYDDNIEVNGTSDGIEVDWSIQDSPLIYKDSERYIYIYWIFDFLCIMKSICLVPIYTNDYDNVHNAHTL